MVFCTLFDSNYLDKGLVMYRSLKKVKRDFKMYILAMDEKCRNVLNDYNYKEIVVIPLDVFVKDNGLEEILKTRPRGEFCWTCTSFLIDYVLTEYNEEICTYVDSDLCFYSDPQCLINEMGDKTVQIVEHRYNPSISGKLVGSKSGRYCVQFNTFKNTPDSLELLRWWKEQCFESCTISAGGNNVWGDQGYLEKWGDKPDVSVLQHPGGGVAPWNVIQYRLVTKDSAVVLEQKSTGKQFPLVFYHYHNISYIERNKVAISVYEPWKEDRSLIEHLYINYLRELDKTKSELNERYGFFPLLKSHPALKNVQKKKKTISSVLRSVDRLFFYKLIDKLVISQKRKKYAYLNEISF